MIILGQICLGLLIGGGIAFVNNLCDGSGVMVGRDLNHEINSTDNQTQNNQMSNISFTQDELKKWNK